MKAPVRAVSFGGGVQSTSLLVLAARGEIDFPTFLFCNVGFDSEDPDTLVYINEISKPFAEQHGIRMLELTRQWRDKSRTTTLLEYISDPNSKSFGIPAFMAGSNAPGRRQCTQRFKIDVVARWLKKHGATPHNKATLALGISTDEIRRMRTSSGFDHYDTSYPLIDLRLDRNACHKIITDAGLPTPPKSSCWFCPFHPISSWTKLKKTRPQLFDRAVELERSLNERRQRLQGREHQEIFLTPKQMPLEQAIHDDQPSLTEESCDSGFCWT